MESMTTKIVTKECICPPGSPGIDGINGLPGMDGLPGINCWDLNQNRINDLLEDINMDGLFSVSDCVSQSHIQPEWFYSSISQSSAAIVTLVVAFIGAYVSKWVEKTRNPSMDTSNCITSIAFHLNLSRVKLFSETIEKYNSEISRCEAQLKKESYTDNYLLFDWNACNRINQQGRPITTHINYSKETVAALQQFTQYYKQLQGKVKITQIENYIHSLNNLKNKLIPIPTEGEEAKRMECIKGDIEKLERTLKIIKEFNSKIAPLRITLILTIVLVLFVSIGGIIYPLTELKVFNEQALGKTIMLISLGFGLLSMLCYFIYYFCLFNKLTSFYWQQDTNTQNYSYSD